MAEVELYDLMSWMSPSWPIGAFAHSSGLEWAVEQRQVISRATTTSWIKALIEHGPLRNDVAMFVYAWRAAKVGDEGRLREVAELAVAAQVGFERRLEATAQGAAFRRIAIASLEPSPDGEALDGLRAGSGAAAAPPATLEIALPVSYRRPDRLSHATQLACFSSLLASIADDDLVYCSAAATLFAVYDIGLRQGLTAWLHGSAANLVSAAQRLVPLGQTDGQKVLRDLRETVFAAVEIGLQLPDGDPFEVLGGCGFLAEIGCMAHETQYTRLFRT